MQREETEALPHPPHPSALTHLMFTATKSGRSARNVSAPKPTLSAAPGARFWTKTGRGAVEMMRSATWRVGGGR